MTCGLGVVAALPAEAQCLAVSRIRGGGPVQIADGVCLNLSGIGPDRAYRAARSLIASGATGLVSWGTAAGLVPSLLTGTIMVPRRVHSVDGTVYTVDPGWRDRIADAVSGPFPISGQDLAETSVVLTGVGDKAELHTRTGAAAGDMESGAVARAATEAGIRFTVVRVVLDPVAMSLPRAALRGIDVWGRVRPVKLLGILLRSPRELVDLVRVGRSFRLAKQALSHVAREAGPDLRWAVRDGERLET